MSNNILELKKVELTQSQIKAVELAKQKGKELYILNITENPNEEWRVNNPFSSLDGVPIEDLVIALFVRDSYRLKRSTEEVLNDFYNKVKNDSISENDDIRIKAEGKLEAILEVTDIIDTPITRNFKRNIDELPF